MMTTTCLIGMSSPTGISLPSVCAAQAPAWKLHALRIGASWASVCVRSIGGGESASGAGASGGGASGACASGGAASGVTAGLLLPEHATMIVRATGPSPKPRADQCVRRRASMARSIAAPYLLETSSMRRPDWKRALDVAARQALQFLDGLPTRGV